MIWVYIVKNDFGQQKTAYLALCLQLAAKTCFVEPFFFFLRQIKKKTCLTVLLAQRYQVSDITKFQIFQSKVKISEVK